MPTTNVIKQYCTNSQNDYYIVENIFKLAFSLRTDFYTPYFDRYNNNEFLLRHYDKQWILILLSKGV